MTQDILHNGSYNVDKKLGVGILSWHGYQSLEASLISYEQAGMLDIFDEAILFLPEQTEHGSNIGHQYGYTVEGSSENLGIFGGFRALANSMTSDYILLLENDWLLIEKPDELRRQIEVGQSLLHDKKAVCIQCRSRKNPGETLTSAEKYYRYFPKPEAGFSKFLTANIRRFLRPEKTRRMIGNASHTETAPERKFPSYYKLDENGFLHTNSSIRNWNNNPFMIERKFFQNTLMTYVDEFKSKRRINNFKNIEIEPNGDYWSKKKWPIAIAPGLFTHNRLGDRGY